MMRSNSFSTKMTATGNRASQQKKKTNKKGFGKEKWHAIPLENVLISSPQKLKEYNNNVSHFIDQ